MTTKETGNAVIVTKSSSHSVEDTTASCTALLHSKGLKVFDVIDQRAEASDVGLDLRSTTLILFGNPRAGTPVMDYAPLAALDLPLKILIWDDGGQTKVSYVAPDELARRYRLTPELRDQLSGIDALTDAVIAP
ncbi:MAG: DUF302 domain-containing protein [Acidimicrobiales bacterium]